MRLIHGMPVRIGLEELALGLRTEPAGLGFQVRHEPDPVGAQQRCTERHGIHRQPSHGYPHRVCLDLVEQRVGTGPAIEEDLTPRDPGRKPLDRLECEPLLAGHRLEDRPIEVPSVVRP
jgi:hypothetical protein